MDLIECGRMSICFYVRQAGPLLHNLAARLGTEMADVTVGMKRRILYPIRRLLTRYDDVLPPDDQFPDEESEHTSPNLSAKKTPTAEVKKPQLLPPPEHKPPPPVERPLAYQNNQRPLPPTPESSKLSLSTKEQSNTVNRRGSRSTAITQMPWYHNVDRKKADELIRNSQDGTFLLRPSSQTQNPLSLTLWYNNRIYNISVRHRPDGKYALGYEKPNEQSFTSIEELVANYQSENLVLYSNGERTGRTLLTGWPPRRE